MTYEEHGVAAAGLSDEQVNNLLRSLGLDSRFNGIVGWLERNREDFVRAGSRQEMAGNYGKLAHAQGSVHAIHILIAQLANLLKPPPTGGMERPPDNI